MCGLDLVVETIRGYVLYMIPSISISNMFLVYSKDNHENILKNPMARILFWCPVHYCVSRCE